MNAEKARPRRGRIDSLDRAAIVDDNFTRFLREWERAPTQAAQSPVRTLPGELRPKDLRELADSQMLSRLLDFAARALRAKNEGFYTIGSAGHEGNAVVGRITRATDPAFLHYRSGAFMMERARKRPDIDPVRDTLLSLMASRDDPISGGRHKVWGSAPLWVLPQTSTIASHLPKALGVAIALGRCRRIGTEPPIPADSIVVCSFGDASINHRTAAGAINCAAWTSHQGLPAPILFVCEDNGLGISVPTPSTWVEAALRPRDDIAWYQADGGNLLDAYESCAAAIADCRTRRRPVFLHLRMTRLLGHAGSDIEPEYRSVEEIEAAEANDPLIRTARCLIEHGIADAEALLARYEALRARVHETAKELRPAAHLADAAEIIAPLAPLHSDEIHREATRTDYAEARAAAFGGAAQLPEHAPPRHLAVNINRALVDLLAKYPQAVLFGEDVARKGGVYHVTPGLQATFGRARVFDTLLDEQSILGMAQGSAYVGLLPFPEIQYLAYVHNAIDQIRGEACSTQFFSTGQFRNPMVIRIAGLGYQKGFGGHFHNDNSIAGLRDIPGLVIACPSRGDDAAGMLRTCAALAAVDGRVVVFLEPIALYMTKELFEAGDGGWQFPYPSPEHAIPIGEARVYHPHAQDLLIITYGNGTYLSLRAARMLSNEHRVQARILDLRWLAPLNSQLIAQHAAECRRVLVVDEGRSTGGLSEAVFTALVERLDEHPPMRRVVGRDTNIPLGAAANLVLPSEADIVETAVALTRAREAAPRRSRP